MRERDLSPPFVLFYEYYKTKQAQHTLCLIIFFAFVCFYNLLFIYLFCFYLFLFLFF
jgi:hypothetical protein